MKTGSARAAVVIAVIVICSTLAGVAIDRVVSQRTMHRRPPGLGGWRSSPEADAKRRNDMLDHMTKDLALSTPQRQGIDSVMQRTDSSLRAIRAETQPRIQQVFQSSRAEIEARLDSAQRIKFKAMQPPPRGDRRP